MKSRQVWSDRFSVPTDAALIGEIVNRDSIAVFEYARERLRSAPGLEESLAWQGLPWRWSFAYSAGAGSPRPAAFLVPDPASPRIASPLSHKLVGQLTMRKLQRAVKEGILRGSVVGDARWCVWELTGKALVDDVVSLALASVRDGA